MAAHLDDVTAAISRLRDNISSKYDVFSLCEINENCRPDLQELSPVRGGTTFEGLDGHSLSI